jgi:hypothetical protein
MERAISVASAGVSDRVAWEMSIRSAMAMGGDASGKGALVNTSTFRYYITGLMFFERLFTTIIHAIN